jgi:hypothetical protein
MLNTALVIVESTVREVAASKRDGALTLLAAAPAFGPTVIVPATACEQGAHAARGDDASLPGLDDKQQPTVGRRHETRGLTLRTLVRSLSSFLFDLLPLWRADVEPTACGCRTRADESEVDAARTERAARRDSSEWSRRSSGSVELAPLPTEQEPERSCDRGG